jgi:hypothetical protein
MGANDKPSARQLRYLRALIDATGQTCSWPKTRREASRAIARLKRAPDAARIEREEDRRAVKDALASQTPASSVNQTEIAGYGSNARWR